MGNNQNFTFDHSPFKGRLLKAEKVKVSDITMLVLLKSW